MIPENIKLLIDLTLGDGWIGYNGNSVRARIEHSIKQENYAKHKEDLLRCAGFDLSSREYESTTKKNLGRRYYQINIFAHPDLKTAHKWIYNKGRKAIDKALIRQMDDRTLAYLFMDDGYAKPCHYKLGKYEKFLYDYPKTQCYRLSTNNFNYEEHLLLQDWLLSFGVRSTLERQYDSHRIVITDLNSKNRFRSTVERYIEESMRYKIINPHTFDDVPFHKEPRDYKDRKRLSEETLNIFSDATVQ